MAKSNFINYIAYKDVQKTLTGCLTSPNKGIINFSRIVNNTTHFTHFTGSATITLYLYFKDQSGSKTISRSGKLSDIKNNNIYTFSAKDLVSNRLEYQSFQNFSIEISEDNKNTAKIVFDDTNNILEGVLYEYNNISFRFSYDVTDKNCHQFDNCILHIGQDINSNITYTNWISPIASGKDISVIVESSLDTDESGYQLFEGSLEKCIKALDSTKWTSSFYKKNQNNAFKGNYNGTFKVNPSKTYSGKELVRFQDIDLSSIGNTKPPATPM